MAVKIACIANRTNEFIVDMADGTEYIFVPDGKCCTAMVDDEHVDAFMKAPEAYKIVPPVPEAAKPAKPAPAAIK